MIQINLLPEELRKQEGTPLPRRLAIFAGAALISLLGSGVLIQRSQLRDLEREKVSLKESLEEASAHIQRDVVPVTRALDSLERRRKVLQRIEGDTVRWGGRLDGLQEVLVNGLDGVWIGGFAYEERKSREKGKTDQIERVFVVDFAASDFTDTRTLFSMSNEERIAEVIHRLTQNHGFMQDVIALSPSAWEQTDTFLKPPWNVKAIVFPLTFNLRAPVQEKKTPGKKPAEKKEG